ncbi:hypothetical protein PIB30_065386 [Stylosanthes scabra]|uniref:Uncharacterized protein n=1 Tax=Stylosanthes scabra TaxID=79078 RepID=A0ABU6SM28_9FABA|nr:hypothetical protein [Stylosanthes scabra]
MNFLSVSPPPKAICPSATPATILPLSGQKSTNEMEDSCLHFSPGNGEMVAGVADEHIALGGGNMERKFISLVGTAK